ncbi:MAG: HAMP domain-containing sensor histidine kinase [Bacillota bacterium]
MVILIGGILAGMVVGALVEWVFLREKYGPVLPEDQMSLILHSVHDGLIVLRGRHVVLANRRASVLLGLEFSASWDQLGLAMRRTPELMAYVEAWRRGEEPQETVMPVDYTHPRYLRVHGALLEEADLPWKGSLLLTLTDVSELHRLEQIRRRFTADISHQIRTPVTAIRLLAEQLPSNSEDFGELATRILGETDRLQRLADEILALSRLEAGEEPMELEDFAVGDLLDEALSAVRSQAERRGVRLVKYIDEDEVWRADYRKLLRTLGIYLDNAIKFSPDGDEVRLGVRTDVDRRVITVADSGPGIPRDELPHVFHRFYRGTRGLGHSGFGLGLAIAKHSMVAAGGDVFANSQVGKGSTFGLTLPIDSAAEDEPGGSGQED